MSWDVTDFEAEVLERSRGTPVLVDFWAAWCGPCRVLGPILERLAEDASGRWTLAKVDTEAFPELAARYGIQSIPNVKLFVDGGVADEFVGVMPEGEIRRWLDRALPSPHAATVASARAAIGRGAFAEAAAILRPVVEAEPGSGEARLALAEALLHEDPEAVPGTVKGLEDDPSLADKADALRALASMVTEAATPERLPEAPVKSRYLEAVRAVRAGLWDVAFAAFVDVLRDQRDYADGAAKDAGRAIVILLGHDHPAVDRHLRAFSSALHV